MITMNFFKILMNDYRKGRFIGLIITDMTSFTSSKLPKDYAERIIELQSKLDDSLSMELITDLNELYRMGIDYYVQFEPRKAQHFQRKMTRLLSDPATLNLIQNRDPNIIYPSQPQLTSKCKIKQEVSKFKNCSGEYVRNIIEHSDKVFQKHINLKNKDLNKQEEILKSRILLKKHRSQQAFDNLQGIIDKKR